MKWAKNILGDGSFSACGGCGVDRKPLIVGAGVDAFDPVSPASDARLILARSACTAPFVFGLALSPPRLSCKYGRYDARVGLVMIASSFDTGLDIEPVHSSTKNCVVSSGRFDNMERPYLARLEVA
jgi:hypothetical protein